MLICMGNPNKNHKIYIFPMLFLEKFVVSFATRNFVSREESEVAGYFVFSHIRMMGYFRLG